MQESESDWIRQAQQSEPGSPEQSEAFTRLVEQFERPVYNLCYRMLGNAEDAEDAAQETFLRAYQAIRRYDTERSFCTWLLSIAAHYCIDVIRRRRYPTISLEDLAVPDIPEIAPGMDAKLSLKEEQRKIRDLLHLLDPVDRAAVVMYYWYDFSYEEICQALSLTSSAVKSRLHRARRAMANEYSRLEAQRKAQEKVFTERRLHESPTI